MFKYTIFLYGWEIRLYKFGNKLIKYPIIICKLLVIKIIHFVIIQI